MELVIGWIGFSIAAAIYAERVGRSGFGWFCLSLLLSPLLGFILLLALPSKVARPIVVNGEVATPDTHVRCPDCKELIRKDARVCMHCRAKLVPQ